MPHQHLTREEAAKRDIGHTAISPALALVLLLAFCAVIVSVPILDEVASRRAGREASHGNAAAILPSGAEIKAVFTSGQPWQALKACNARMLGAIRRYEDGLKDDSATVQWLVPRMQVPITGWLKGGNEDAYVGRDGWVFFRRDVDHLTGLPFLAPRVLAARAAEGNEIKAPPQPDPVKGILHFRDQLAARGIALLVVPVPPKAAIHPERFSSRYDGASAPVLNASHPDFIARLRSAGVEVFDPAPVLWAERHRLGRPVYLATDTHWTPEGMESCAQALAAYVGPRLPKAAPSPWTTLPTQVANLGDSAGQLRLPAGQGFFRPETVTVRTVENAGHLWRPDPSADVLLLGDSFANIYSLAGMGWGEAGGLAERLSLALGRPVDAILRNDAGSYATRQMLATELARGRDRLAGKRLVIWEFACRELSGGDWKAIALRLGEPGQATFYVPAAGKTATAKGVVASATSAPRPGSVTYRDHIVAVHLVDLDVGDGRTDCQALVYMHSMISNVWTRAARYRVGDRIAVRLRPWPEVEARFGRLNRGEPADANLQLADPCWGEEEVER